ncbi:uncharacterized protein LOC133891748 isoform X2 [Phragmites australis]|uniref:uncharacterized protein LOC133891748 isoform X2 n=1 Tax=Phragmites australis TaxID=29695 RepID=UPI002D7702BE|nr:uncharacterized protein LOC133891748 isoform X2 [Phragmites australis]
MRRDVLRCKELVERSRQRTVSLPTMDSSYGGSTNKRGPASALEKSWAMEDRKHLDALIARSFYSGGISFNFARNPYFQQAISFAYNRNLAGYKMPGYNKLRTSLLKQERGHIEMLLQSSKSTWQEKGVTICADGWSDPQRRPLINFVAVSEKAPMFLRADNCEGQVKTKEYIAEKLKSVIEEVGRQNVVQIITDNAANCKVVCMLKRMVEVKMPLKQMVISEAWDIYKDDAQTAALIHDKVLSEVWWRNVEYILKITTPIYEMIRVADTNTPCLHLIYEMWDSMIEKVKKEIYQWEGKQPDEESNLYLVIHKILVDRWTKGNNPLHCIAHSLNPRYYSQEWLHGGVGRVPPHKNKEVSKMRMTCFKKYFRIPTELSQVKEEYARFSSCSEEFNDPDSLHDRWFVSPMTWWTNHGQSVPLLMNLAIKLVSQPASSSCCERNWSTYSFIHSVKRNALTPERAEDLVYVHSNLRHLSKRTDDYKKGESRMWDVGGDSFESLSGLGILEVANLSLDEPELQAVSFGDVEADIWENEDEANPEQT